MSVSKRWLAVCLSLSVVLGIVVSSQIHLALHNLTAFLGRQWPTYWAIP
jgi:hypothetical protein